MKTLFTILFISYSIVLIAQNWSPIRVNEKMNYKHSDSSYISHTIWIENITPQGNDTIYELNKIVIDCPGEPLKVLRNQPSFLQKNMTKQDSGKYLFSLPNLYLIKSLAKMWDSWIFDPVNNITATLNGHSITDVLGVLDSVKTIGLSDGSQIKLSKNFGIIKFPDFATGGYYELVGMQDSEYGEIVIDFWDIYDFEVGDVFQYEFIDTDASITDYQTQKYTVESKEIFDDSIKYQMHIVIDGYWIDSWSWEDYYYSLWYTKEICYIDSLNHPANKFNYQFIKMWEDYWGYFFDDDSYSKVFLSKDTLYNRVKWMGSSLSSPNGIDEMYFELEPYNDTLFRTTSLSGQNVLVEYIEGLGRTIYDFYNDEQRTVQLLEGYVKNGDTVGIITPDSLLLTKISDLNTKSENWLVYPNPVEERLNFDVKNSIVHNPYDLELRNLQGQLVKEVKNIQTALHTINVAYLKPGVYFYTIKEKGVVVQQGKLIKK